MFNNVILKFIDKFNNSNIKLIIVSLFILVVLFGTYLNILFLFFSLLLIIILCYSQRKQMSIKYNTENYKPYCNDPNYLNPPSRVKTCTKKEIEGNTVAVGKNGNIIFERPSARRFCNDCEEVQPNNTAYIYPSQKLLGCPNPKTNIPPIVVPPIASLDYWKTNNLVTMSAINTETQEDAYQSGFQITTCCGSANNEYLVPRGCNKPSRCDKKINEKYNIRNEFGGIPYDDDNMTLPNNNEENILRQSGERMEKNYIENYDQELPPNKLNFENSQCINLSCGYDKNQIIESGLPSNYAAGNCQRDPAMKEYNENLFTQTIQPGIYTKSQINEPINSNIGISFTQPFLPTSCNYNDQGDVFYVEHDPNTLTSVIEPDIDTEDTPTYYNVYDPRFSGYGTSYRAYTNRLLGQTRFMYDDIDAVKMPNYIVRSNIDTQPFADQYGEIPCDDEFGNKYNSRIRELANDAFTRSAIQFRTDMSERLMRKRNAEMWQLRQAPISTSGQRMGNGGRGSANCV
jgi:hypothetical protein